MAASMPTVAMAAVTTASSSVFASFTPKPSPIAESLLLPALDEVLNCRLVGPFSIAVQVLVGTLGFSTLIIKRHFERPRRPWLVWYVLNLTLDCTIGILFIAGYLRLFGYLAQRLNVKGLESGHYGDPPSWKRWIKQASIFCASMICMKLTVVLMITLLPLLVGLGDLILKPVQMTHSPRFQIIFVMAIWPLSLNIFESWIIDQFIKTKRGMGDIPTDGHIPLATTDVGQGASSFELSNALYPSSSSSSGSRTLGGLSARDTRLSIEMSEFDIANDGDDNDDVDVKYESGLAHHLHQLPAVSPADALAIRLKTSSPSDQSALLLPGGRNPFSDSEQDDADDKPTRTDSRLHKS
ncbi:hypothetical protein GGH94_003952 [Coemansia aciculifera]|uniref:Uncharacterized protein n=1 Tax=Coemansia aciculifera TaxID=417176 RepID=A0A9W8IMU0_9FUNG|nr:hypothetical protein GGH94_003952 [Coemansia aciculifera]